MRANTREAIAKEEEVERLNLDKKADMTKTITNRARSGSKEPANNESTGSPMKPPPVPQIVKENKPVQKEVKVNKPVENKPVTKEVKVDKPAANKPPVSKPQSLEVTQQDDGFEDDDEPQMFSDDDNAELMTADQGAPPMNQNDSFASAQMAK